MPTLFISLGTSPAIVPEAFLLPDTTFSAVHVITTASIKTEDLAFIADWFHHRAPGTALTLSRVANFTDFKSEQDHFRFEEILYRWLLHHHVPPSERHICLTGGFKTMSAAMQKAAAVLGAAEVFHVLCDLPPAQQPKTAEEIEHARANNHLHWIKLGPESGWPQLRQASSATYPLAIATEEPNIQLLTAPDHAFRDHLQAIVQRSHRIAENWDRLANLPFPTLATWPASDLAWLHQPLDPIADRPWVAALPKIELHCHLGGFATHGELLHQVRAAATTPDSLPPLTEPPLPPGWPLPTQPISLPEYMALGNANGSALLRDPGCLRRHCELLYRHLLEQNIAYAEIRCSPVNYASKGRSPWTVLCEIKTAFDAYMAASAAENHGTPACHVNLLLIGTRKKEGDHRTTILKHLMHAITADEHWREDTACRVVGVDLAGFEDRETRAHYYREDFRMVHRAGLALTIHAGENDDSEGIWSAVFDLNARRLGHALSLVESPELMRSVADRGIGVEMCPYTNLQIKGYPLDTAASSASAKQRYPLLAYLRAGIPVTVNTDNPGISAATLTDNLLLAARLCPGLTRMDLLHLQSHAVHAAFLTPRQRTSLLTRLTSRLRP